MVQLKQHVAVQPFSDTLRYSGTIVEINQVVEGDSNPIHLKQPVSKTQ